MDKLIALTSPYFQVNLHLKTNGVDSAVWSDFILKPAGLGSETISRTDCMTGG